MQISSLYLKDNTECVHYIGKPVIAIQRTAGYFKDLTLQINTLCGQNVEFFSVKSDGETFFEGLSNFFLLLVFHANICSIISSYFYY